jgi:hypothetical protein
MRNLMDVKEYNHPDVHELWLIFVVWAFCWP